VVTEQAGLRPQLVCIVRLLQRARPSARPGCARPAP
jgi:hypothetical protein